LRLTVTGKDNAGRASRRFPATEDGELEDLEVAVDVGVADVPEPGALVLDEGEDVGGLVGPVDVVARDLVAGLAGARALVVGVDRVDHQVIGNRLQPR
jgi:hypothetical protein